MSAADIAANKNMYYGAVAQNYTKGGLTYRIFYVDTKGNFGDGANTIYLKADYNSSNSKSLSTDISALTDADITKYKNMNPLWAAQRGSLQSSWKNNEKAAAWLCAPSQWTAYADSSIVGSYAIGAPSAEMYVASYNDVAHNNGTAKDKLSTEYRATNYPGYIYKIDGTEQNNGYYTNSNTIDNTGYNKMYTSNGKSMWLASPSSNFSRDVCGVSNSYLDHIDYLSTYGVGLLVSLPSTFTVEVEQ